MSDRAFSSEVASVFAATVGAHHTVHCHTEGCGWAVHTGCSRTSQTAYEDHLRTDPRHTDSVWIDRDGRERRGLRSINGNGEKA